MGWWGPAKGVPLIAFVVAEVPIPTSEVSSRSNVPIIVKRLQEALQVKLKHIFRAVHLIPLSSEGNAGHAPPEVRTNFSRSLFTIPTGPQPFIHIVPATAFATTSSMNDIKNFPMSYTFEEPISLSSWLSRLSDSRNEPKPRQSSKQNQLSSILDDYGDRLLRNFVAHWVKAATSKSRKGNDPKQPDVPLPTAIQFFSAVVPLKALLYGIEVKDGEDNFKKAVIGQSPGAKGMIQQIDVVLRKKIKDTVEIERVFSRTNSLDIMRKCIETYLQESPPYYTQKYHLWKREKVMHLYKSLSRGPCAAEYGLRLEKECNLIWTQGRQACEHISLTGKECRLKLGHGKRTAENDDRSTKHVRDDRIMAGSSRHSSGCNFFHSCNCGKSQRLREDPFDVRDANFGFYDKFTCCLADGHAAIDYQGSQLGKNQNLVLRQEFPLSDASLLYLGPASSYRNSVGLERYEGIANNTNYMLPWTLATKAELATRNQQRPPVEPNPKTIDKSEWPLPGKLSEVVNLPTKPASLPMSNLEAFPALGTVPAAEATKVPEEPKKEKRRRDARRRDKEHRLEGLVRGYVGAEYECPLGHRFLSCADGRVCKLGHKGHPKEHGNYFVHQDLPLFVLCLCSFANHSDKPKSDITAQLQRLYMVTPAEVPVTIAVNPIVKFKGENDEMLNLKIFDDAIILPPNGVYVLRLPYIYQHDGKPILPKADVQKRVSNGFLQKDCLKVHFLDDHR
ncbi:hypothetical protein EC973_006943 [Apophysomyces ossiformis]|uniref:Nonsense-mediated mRNA decay factor SMG8 n=1 Tax=Apophysomyces ossiformis TaxID=679940 RepID=A0A8H7EQ30_9FUNG|nr:hypothetical protein EC973_006943 [Apophysomyces ossiformis]